MPIGPGLESDGNGSIQTDGSTPSEPSAYLYGPNGFVGLGTGLEIGSDGSLKQSGGTPYIYCVPQFSELPVTYPPPTDAIQIKFCHNKTKVKSLQSPFP